VSENPVIKLKDARLKDLDLGNFDYSIANLLSHFANDLNNDLVPSYHPVCDYGAWYDTATSSKTVYPQDLRPFFKEYFLLKKMFCQFTGYKFKSPIHEQGTQFGVYILNNEFKGQQFGAKAVLGNDVTYVDSLGTDYGVPMLPLMLDNISASKTYSTFDPITQRGYDNGVITNGYYNNNRQFTGISGTYKVNIDLWIQSNLIDPSNLINYGIDVQIQINSIVVQTIENYRTVTTPQFSRFKIDSNNFTAVATDVVSIVFVPRNYTFVTNIQYDYDLILGKASAIEFIPVSVQASPAYIERLNKFINPDYKCTDLLKGSAHARNASYHIDYITKTVTLYLQREVTNLYGTGTNVGGYYSTKQIDLRPFLICDSARVEEVEKDVKRKQTFKYKDSTDPFLEKNKDLGKYTLDLGEEYTEGETTSENPFFEPTGANQNHPLFKGVSTYPIAVLRDNNEGKKSFNIAPRLVILGNGTPFGANGISNYWSFFNAQQQIAMPTAYMFPSIPYNGATTYENVMYGGVKYSLFDTYYKKYLSERRSGERINILVWLNSVNYSKISLRHNYVLQVNGKPIVARIEEVKDYKLTSMVSTPIVFRPIKHDYSC
jgi:hypothetical protein